MNFCRYIFIVLFLSSQALGAQENDHSDHDHYNKDVYELDFKKDAIIMGAGVLSTFIGDRMLRSQSRPTLTEISGLNKSGLYKIDRSTTDNNSDKAETVSDIILFSSALLPFALYVTNRSRGEELEVLFMAAETFLITNGITNMVKASVGRYRPYNYNPMVSDERKLSRTSNRSFFSGHASNTAAFSFLAARVINDLHPHWKKKKVFSWTVAAALPLAVSYGRWQAGKHFPTDVLTGYIFGAGIGLLIPHLHKKDNSKINIGYNSISFSSRF